MKNRKLVVVTLSIALAGLVLAAGAPTASAGGTCNPRTLDINCSYTEDGKTYQCTLWGGYGCYGDLSPWQAQ